MAQLAMHGTRLAYVVIPIRENVTRHKAVLKPNGGGIGYEEVKQPGGFMVYFPRGHVLRMGVKELKRYSLHKRPTIVSLQGLQDPNSPLGKMMMAQDQDERIKGFKELEALGVRLATAKTGPNLLTVNAPVPSVKDDDDGDYIDLSSGMKLAPGEKAAKTKQRSEAA